MHIIGDYADKVVFVQLTGKVHELRILISV